MRLASLGLAAFLASRALAAADTPLVTRDLPIGFLPAAWVTDTLRKTLPPPGRFVLLTLAGPARITDQPRKIADAQQALEALAAAPALVSLTLSFEVKGPAPAPRPLAASQPVLSDGLPVPSRYSPPRFIVGPGSVTVIPSQPHFDHPSPGRSANAGVLPDPAPPDAPAAGGILRRLVASAAAGKSVVVPVQTQAADPAALRRVAGQLGAVLENEPAWTQAGTAFELTPQISGGVLEVKIVPQIVLPAAAGAEPRRLPLALCSAGIPLTRSAPARTGLLPRASAEFYAAFFGVAPPPENAKVALTLTGAVQYLGGPPP